MDRPLLLIACVASLAIGALALEKPPQGRPQPTAIAGNHEKPAAPEEEAPVPVPPPSDKALSYYRSGNVLWVVDLVWGLLIPALFLFTGFSARIRTWAQKLGRKWFFVVGIYFVSPDSL
jgi:hypothetical protein